MRIFYLNTNDSNGGAAIAAQRLHKAFNTYTDGNSSFGVLEKSSDDPTIIPIGNTISRSFNRTFNKLENNILRLKHNNHNAKQF